MGSEVDVEVLKDLERIQNIRKDLYEDFLKKRTIIFNESIDSYTLDLILLPLIKFEQDDSNLPVNLILHTPGGSVGDSLFLINLIDNYKKPLNIYVQGYACSMGTYILCAGNNNPNVTKYAYPFSYGLMHAGESALSGEANMVKDTFEFTNLLEDRLNAYIIKNTKITEEDLHKRGRKQWYMFSDEMKEKGLVDVIIGDNADDQNEKGSNE